MFKRSTWTNSSHKQHTRIDKAHRLKRSNASRDNVRTAKLQRSLADVAMTTSASQLGLSSGNMPLATPPSSPPLSAPGESVVVTIAVGVEERLFAAHEDVLRQAPFFDAAFRKGLFSSQCLRVALPDEEPEVFSAVLEYLYKGDYFPRVIRARNSRRLSLEEADSTRVSRLETPPRTSADEPVATPGVTVYVSSLNSHILRDTVIYCAAERYGLDRLKSLSLRKQGLQRGIDVGTILRSAAYTYAHTPEHDSVLRAHYLALIIRCRKTFTQSGTMQAAMEQGGSKLYFDLFVAMCNHVDDVVALAGLRSPRTI